MVEEQAGDELTSGSWCPTFEHGLQVVLHGVRRTGAGVLRSRWSTDLAPPARHRPLAIGDAIGVGIAEARSSGRADSIRTATCRRRRASRVRSTQCRCGYAPGHCRCPVAAGGDVAGSARRRRARRRAAPDGWPTGCGSSSSHRIAESFASSMVSSEVRTRKPVGAASVSASTSSSSVALRTASASGRGRTPRTRRPPP